MRRLAAPGYGHVGLLVGADGAPLSKRHGAPASKSFASGIFASGSAQSLIPVGHTGDVDGGSARGNARAFSTRTLGRAPARFEESQLIHWQKETLQRMSAAEIGAWLGRG